MWKAAPSGMLSLWTALEIVLTSINDSAKQSAYSSSSFSTVDVGCALCLVQLSLPGQSLQCAPSCRGCLPL